MKNILKAISDFQKEVPVIHKGTDGYGYSYADLPTILEVINPLLKKHGLGFTQLIDGTSLKTIIFHTESGEILESVANIPQGVQLPKMNDFQVLGSAITYMRRYALSAALGLVTDKDTDAEGEQVNKKQEIKTEKKWFSEDDLKRLAESKNIYSSADEAIKKISEIRQISYSMMEKIKSLYK